MGAGGQVCMGSLDMSRTLGCRGGHLLPSLNRLCLYQFLGISCLRADYVIA